MIRDEARPHALALLDVYCRIPGEDQADALLVFIGSIARSSYGIFDPPSSYCLTDPDRSFFQELDDATQFTHEFSQRLIEIIEFDRSGCPHEGGAP